MSERLSHLTVLVSGGWVTTYLLMAEHAKKCRQAAIIIHVIVATQSHLLCYLPVEQNGT